MSEQTACHARCYEAAQEDVATNFLLDRGFDAIDCPVTYDPEREAERVEWGTITLNTDYRAARRYLDEVAYMYLSDGNTTCKVAEDEYYDQH